MYAVGMLHCAQKHRKGCSLKLLNMMNGAASLMISIDIALIVDTMETGTARSGNR